MVDKSSEKITGLNFARFLVGVEMNTEFPEKMCFRNEKGMLLEQKIVYDWKPTLCKCFQKHGHAEEESRRKRRPTVNQDDTNR